MGATEGAFVALLVVAPLPQPQQCRSSCTSPALLVSLSIVAVRRACGSPCSLASTPVLIVVACLNGANSAPPEWLVVEAAMRGLGKPPPNLLIPRCWRGDLPVVASLSLDGFRRGFACVWQKVVALPIPVVWRGTLPEALFLLRLIVVSALCGRGGPPLWSPERSGESLRDWDCAT